MNTNLNNRLRVYRAKQELEGILNKQKHIQSWTWLENAESSILALDIWKKVLSVDHPKPYSTIEITSNADEIVSWFSECVELANIGSVCLLKTSEFGDAPWLQIEHEWTSKSVQSFVKIFDSIDMVIVSEDMSTQLFIVEDEKQFEAYIAVQNEEQKFILL